MIEIIDSLLFFLLFHSIPHYFKIQPKKKKKIWISIFISNISIEYIILDDLTVKFKKPNICDIKIGTRQHGDDVPADKKIRHSNKVKTTTSKPLGLRMCGIQVWKKKQTKYILQQ